jgi:DNA-binding NarL/FixJ family response regulator
VCKDFDFVICAEAISPEQALLYSELHLPDIVIFSFRCAVRHQTLVVSQIARLSKKVSVLVYSSLALTRATHAYIRAGASGFLGEESTSEELIAVLGGLMAGFSMIPIKALKQHKIKLAHRPSKSFALHEVERASPSDLSPDEAEPQSPFLPELSSEA